MNFAIPRSLNPDVESEKYIPLAPIFTSIGGAKINIKENLTASIRYRYLANRPANADNSLTAKGYFLLDANVNYTLNSFDITFLVENIANTTWKEAQFETESQLQNAAMPVTQIHFTAGTPFSAKMKINYNF